MSEMVERVAMALYAAADSPEVEDIGWENESEDTRELLSA